MESSKSSGNKTQTQKRKRRSFISKNNRILNISRSSVKSKKSQKSNSKKSKSKSPSRSSSKKSNKSKSKSKNSKSNTPYIVSSGSVVNGANEPHANGHNRFHTENIGKKPTLNANEKSLHTVANPNKMSLHRKPPQIRRHRKNSTKKKLKLGQLSPNSSHLPPLPPTPYNQKRSVLTGQNKLANNVSVNEYNEWLLVCFKNSIIDSLIELMHSDDLKAYVFDEGMVCHHMIGNDALSAIEYLFECQFAFMSNGNAYLDFNGFAAGMRKCNIHFESPEVAIPLIFEQLVGIKQKSQIAQIDYNHVFVAEDTFVEWMMSYIRNKQQLDERTDKLFGMLHSIYTQSKYSKYKQKKKLKKEEKVIPSASE